MNFDSLDSLADAVARQIDQRAAAREAGAGLRAKNVQNADELEKLGVAQVVFDALSAGPAKQRKLQMAADSAAATRRAELFPNANRLQQRSGF